MSEYTILKFNILILSIFFLLLLGDIYLLMTWLINILILFNVKGIPKKGFFYLIRLTCYFIHFIIFYVVYLIVNNKSIIFLGNKGGELLIVIIIFSIIYLFLNRKMLKLFFSVEYISSISKKDTKEYIYSLYVTFGSVLAEELYFRYLIIEKLNNIGVFSIFVSAMYFMLYHYLLPWGGIFKKRDLLSQICFGVIAGSIYYITNSLLLCIVGHLVMNIHMVIFYIKSYIYYYVMGGEHIDSNKVFDELEV